MIVKIGPKRIKLKGRAKDLTDRVFGRLTALKPVGYKNGVIVWYCRCACGVYISPRGSDLTSGNTKSCGCLQPEIARLCKSKSFNDCVVVGSTVLIRLVSHKDETRAWTRVDKSDLNKIKSYRWSLTTFGYAMAYPSQGRLPMHRLIMRAELRENSKLEVDHKDSNSLNNCRDNLRVCTHAENLRNSSLGKNNTTGYKGVSFDKRLKKCPYYTKIQCNGTCYWLGSFSTPEEASTVYNAKAKELHKDFAKTNKT